MTEPSRSVSINPDILNTDPDRGLTDVEVASRRERFGYNELRETRPHFLRKLAGKFWGLTAWMLEIILVLSWILHRYSDVYVIAGLLVLNAVISFIEEQRASGAVEALKSKLQVNARVLRGGQWHLLPARELVPGDIIRLRAGDFVPADAQILRGKLYADQSALTGESHEVEKDPQAALYSGSIIKRSEATGVVTLTGASTYFGNTAQLVQFARPKLHVEEEINHVVKLLLGIVGVLLALALVFSILRGINLLEILPLALVLLLSAIPVALPVMFTVSMAVGSMELARKNVLVTRLSATEDAASMDVLCVDKTGTITQNRLAVADVLPLEGFSEKEALLYGALASQEANQDAIDLAFLAAAKQRGLLDESYRQREFVPFDPQTRHTEALIEGNGRAFRVWKGAVSALAQVSGLGQEEIGRLEARTEEYAQRGYRVLAVAQGETGGAPRLVGLVTLYDQPRPDSGKLIKELRALGIAVKMLTGDGLAIARQIAQEVGLGDNVSRAPELKALTARDPAEARRIADASDGFAEVYPEDKYIVVKSLQSAGHVVGMTGDGVNDAPALRQAEVGIAVNSATDVTKGAASVVLTAEGLSSILDLVQNGRKVHQRVSIWVLNKISRTILKASFVVIAFMLTGKYVVAASALILITFMTDFIKIALSTDNVPWSRKPEPQTVTHLTGIAAVLGLLMVVEALGLFFLGLDYLNIGLDDPVLYTFTFEILFYFAIFSIFVVRERRHFWSSAPSRTLAAVIAVDILLALGMSTFGVPGVLVPLPLGHTLVVAGYSFVFSLLLNDLVKSLLMRHTAWAQ